MSARYGTPEAFRQAVERRLRDEALRTGAELQRLRQLLVFERFLVRVTHVFGDDVVLKGGVVMELRLPRARTTRDIDLRMTGSPEAVLPRLQEAGRLVVDDFMTFEVAADAGAPEITAEGLAYEGRRYRAEARLAGKPYGGRFGVDVAFAEPILWLPEQLPGRVDLGFAGIAPASFRVYPAEVHIAEKFHAYTLPRARTNSRVKDLPDIPLLATVRDFEASRVRAAIERTFSHRKTHAVPGTVPEPPRAWQPIYARMAALDRLPWATLEEVTNAAQRFLDPALAGDEGIWSAAAWAWQRSK